MKQDKIKFAVSSVKEGIDAEVARAVATQTKKELEQYYENVHFGTHMDAIDQPKDFSKKISIKRHDKYLALFVDDEMFPCQKDLVISSSVNEATTVSVTFVMVKGGIPTDEIEV